MSFAGSIVSLAGVGSAESGSAGGEKKYRCRKGGFAPCKAPEFERSELRAGVRSVPVDDSLTVSRACITSTALEGKR